MRIKTRYSLSLQVLTLIPVALSVAFPQVRDARRQRVTVGDDSGSFQAVQLSEEGRRKAGITVIPKVSQELRSLAASAETLPVFISLRDQPLRSTYNRVATQFDARLARAEEHLVKLVRSQKPHSDEDDD